ncbi:family 10 glycosylhydrolase [Sphingobacterium sp. DK4209]|uniref:Family 10 glycosylhydrolase n=1 Tax=Sphingobacterium zhuxiongii TaxID=2662364 RepID=A0A5Q0QFR6_9SPHI|nr:MULTISPECIES: alpha amylase family protein [unclassified Sphingobacterium]MVZ65324.1 family 10 glycosylhydrolase [Sphingobacterium sp. DK4209]QGA26412.1 family 10 glycosylhydrolase [Sphingobacterium sp. dk4302]
MSKIMRRLYALLAICIGLQSTACSTESKSVEEPGENEVHVKPKYLWFDAEANFERFSNKDSIDYYVKKAKDVGFTDIVVDVKPIYGKALYKSSFIPELTTVGSYSRTIDWDYLQYFIDQAKKNKLRVTVSTTFFPAGHPGDQSGLVYEDKKWDGKTGIAYTSNNELIDIRNDKTKVAAFMNPLDPDVRKFVIDMVREIVTKYDVQGYILDYCRFSGIETEFSETTRKAFEDYMGEKVPNFPRDIFYYQNNQKVEGRFAKKWYEFRAMVIHDYVKEIKETAKGIKPDIKIEYWAASWYNALYANGQNWASKKYDTHAENTWATENYKNAGFAEHLDAFQIGTYLNTIYGKNDPESIEYGLIRGKRLLKGDTKLYGSIYALNHKDNIEQAIDLCLKESEGLMVFDIVQVIGFNQWDAIKRGIANSGF